MNRFLVLLVLFVSLARSYSATGPDSLRALLPASTGTARVDVLNDLANQLKYVSTDSVRLYSERALALARDLDYVRGQSYALSNLAFVHVFRGEKDPALDKLSRALALDRSSGYLESEAKNLFFLGNLHLQFRDHEKASQYYLEALPFYEQHRDTIYIAKINVHLGIVYGMLKDFDSSQLHLEKGYGLHRRIGNKKGAAMALSNLISLYIQLGKWEDGIACAREALADYEGTEEYGLLAHLHEKLGKCCTGTGEYDEALRHLQRALDCCKKANDQLSQASIINRIGEIHLKTGRLDLAKKNFDRALELGQRENMSGFLSQTHRLLHDYYILTHNAPMALAHFERYAAIRDSVTRAERHRQIAELETRYETEKKEHENSVLRSSLEIEARENVFHQRLVGCLGAGILLLVVLGFFILRSMRQKNELLEKENRIKEAEKETIRQETLARQKAAFSRRLIQRQEEESKRIAGELHDGIGQYLLIIKNNLTLAKRDRTFETQVDESMGLLDRTLGDVSTLSHALHPSELDQLGLTLAVHAMIERIGKSSELAIDMHGLDGLDGFFPREDRINVFRLLQESLNNILKHARASHVRIEGRVDDGTMVLSVVDDGAGFDPESMERADGRPHMGIAGMRERVSMLRGEMDVDSSPGKGTSVTFRFRRSECNEERQNGDNHPGHRR